MDNYFSTYVVTMDSNDIFVPIGWCPDVVRVTNIYDGQDNLWTRLMGTDGGLERAAAGDRNLRTDKGIKLVKFTDSVLNTTSDPSEVDPSNWVEANGIQITSDAAMMNDNYVVLVEAWRMNNVFIKATHDGTTSSNTYFEDASFDFLELGVSGNGQWLIYNITTNCDYAYVKSVTKPMGKSKHCRIYTATDAAGTATTAADFDTGDICYIFPVSAAWYPMSDIGLMT